MSKSNYFLTRPLLDGKLMSKKRSSVSITLALSEHRGQTSRYYLTARTLRPRVRSVILSFQYLKILLDTIISIGEDGPAL